MKRAITARSIWGSFFFKKKCQNFIPRLIIFHFSCDHFTELINRNKVLTTKYAISVNECCKIKAKFVGE